MREPITRLALVLWPPDRGTPSGYGEADRLELGIYIRTEACTTYKPFHGLKVPCEFVERKSAYRDWTEIAQALAFWASESAIGDARPIVELFLPYQLLHQLMVKDFLNVRCLVDPEDKSLGEANFASLCPAVVPGSCSSSGSLFAAKPKQAYWSSEEQALHAIGKKGEVDLRRCCGIK